MGWLALIPPDAFEWRADCSCNAGATSRCDVRFEETPGDAFKGMLTYHPRVCRACGKPYGVACREPKKLGLVTGLAD